VPETLNYLKFRCKQTNKTSWQWLYYSISRMISAQRKHRILEQKVLCTSHSKGNQILSSLLLRRVHTENEAFFTNTNQGGY
jgi:hypothetical protein